MSNFISYSTAVVDKASPDTMGVAASNLDQILPLPLGSIPIGSTVEGHYTYWGGCTWGSFAQQRGWLGTAGIGDQHKEDSLRGCRKDFLRDCMEGSFRGYSLGFQEACMHLGASYLVP